MRGFALRMVSGREPVPAGLRPDMARQLEAEGGALPAGPKWALEREGVVVALGGLEPSGAGASMGWLLTSDLDRRGWAAARLALRDGLRWARSRCIRRIRVAASGNRVEAVAMLERLGFTAEGLDVDGDVVLKMELK